jgi:hypothetical protein
LPEAVYRTSRDVQTRKLKRWMTNSPVISVEVVVRRLVTPAVIDVATRALIPVGPEIDDEAGWKAYRRQRPDRHYAVGKRTLPTADLRRYGLQNLPLGEHQVTP